MAVFSNASAFISIYLLSTLSAIFVRFSIPKPKLLYIKSQGLYNFITFPYSLISRDRKTKKKKKDRHLMLSELIFGILTQVTLIGAIVLQLLHPMPCKVLEVTFARHRGLDFIVDTYNQKIPLCLIFSLLLVEILFFLATLMLHAFRNKERRKKLGFGAFIGMTAICLLVLIVLIHFIYMLF